VFAHVGNPEEGGYHSCTLLGDLGQFLLGRPETLVIYLRILWSFKISAFLWEPQIWQILAVINSAAEVPLSRHFRNYPSRACLSCRWGLKIEISLRKAADWEMQKCWDLLASEMSQWRISREISFNGTWRSWGNYRHRTSGFYTESVLTLFKWQDA
jgi:hypothetical protein